MKKRNITFTIKILMMIMILLSVFAFLSTKAEAAGSSNMEIKINLTYGQTEARAMLDYINKFRIGNDVDGQKPDLLN